MKKFDILIIGGGPGGYVAAIRAAQLGKNCALVEKDKLGGVCLNWGCIPTKSLLRNAEVISQLGDGDFYGFSFDEKGVKIDYAKAQSRSREVSARLVKGIDYLMKKNGVSVINDEAAFLSSNTVKLSRTNEIIQADSIVIASGSRPNHLKDINFSSPYILDSKKALQLTKVPKSVVIIGAGAIGLEFASVWEAYGSSVTILEMLPRVLPNEDEDISKEVRRQYEKIGIKTITGAKVVKVTADAAGAAVEYSADGVNGEIACEYVLVSTGILPNTESIGLNQTGVKTNIRGYIEVDDHMRTNVKGIWAIGDVAGKLALAHVASAQGMIAVNDIVGESIDPIIYENIPRCTYGHPEVASAGLTEQQTKDRGLEIVTGTFPFSANGKAISYGQAEGFVKIIAGKKYGEILGVHMVGPHVTEMIAAAVGYLSLEVTIDELAKVIHPHPTLSEAVMEAAHLTQGHGIHI